MLRLCACNVLWRDGAACHAARALPLPDLCYQTFTAAYASVIRACTASNMPGRRLQVVPQALRSSTARSSGCPPWMHPSFT